MFVLQFSGLFQFHLLKIKGLFTIKTNHPPSLTSKPHIHTCYTYSVTQHVWEGVDSQVWWWCICILLVGAAVTGTDRLSTYPFIGVVLPFSSSLFFIYIFLIFIFDIFHFYFFIFYVFIDFFNLLFSDFIYVFNFFNLSLLISFPLSFPPLGLFLIWVCVLVMSIDSKFVLDFIAQIMAIMSAHICQECVHVCAHSYVSCMSQRLSKTCESSRCLASQTFSFSSYFFLDCTALWPTVILRAHTCLD